jgi:ketosteroid isomerase-like protein
MQMKFIISLMAVAALSFVTSAFAQEESPSASPEEKASATVEEKPAPTPSPEESKAKKKEEPAAEKKESPAGQKKETTAASTTEKSASPVAAPASGKKMSTDAALKDMENRWEASFASHDLSVIQGMVAADFVGVSPKFKFVNKSGMLAEFKSNKDTYKSAKNESLRVTSFGPNVAVVTGRTQEKGTGKDGKAFDRSYYFTDTWMQRNGQWQCIASQAAEARK